MSVVGRRAVDALRLELVDEGRKPSLFRLVLLPDLGEKIISLVHFLWLKLVYVRSELSV